MKTIYVSPKGKDTNPGTKRRPKRTVRAGLELLSAKDTLIVGNGTYEGDKPPCLS